MSKLYVGVDPGMDGAIAFWQPQLDTLAIYDMPVLDIRRGTKRRVRRIDLPTFARITDHALGWNRKAVCAVELVGARPGEGVATSFDFGFATGAVHGVLNAYFVTVESVKPSIWKPAMRCPADKSGARARACQLFPKHMGKWPLVRHAGRAEAAMLAMWAQQHDVQPEAADADTRSA